jgi:hypothetical protein
VNFKTHSLHMGTSPVLLSRVIVYPSNLSKYWSRTESKAAINMSRFFHGGDSDSESSSSDEEELYSDHEQAEASEEETDKEQTESEEEESSSDDEGKGTGANRFLKPSGGGAEDSEESEDEDRVTVVKSAKDKRLEELEGTIRVIDNAEKINDWPVISTGLWRLLQRAHVLADFLQNSTK